MVKQRSLSTLILLSIVTCGIYSIYFWYMWTEDVNKMCAGDGKESPNYIIVTLLSVVTCGIYGIFWFYKQGNRLQEDAPKFGLTFSENGTSVLMWMIFGSFIIIGPYVAMHILIKNVNAMALVYNSRLSSTNP